MCLAIPGKVVETFDQRGMRMAKVQFGGIVREACLEYVPETQVGEYVLVHVGFAISRIDEAEAERTYQALRELDQLTELESPVVEEIGTGRASAMKYLDEYRDGDVAKKIVGEMRRIQTRPWVLMEVCGGQTHSIVKHGIDHLLPEGVELVHGPGCPVCVTPLEMIDKAHAIARQAERYLLLLRRHVARARFGWRSVHHQVTGGRCAHCVLPARLPEDRARQSRKASGIFRDRL